MVTLVDEVRHKVGDRHEIICVERRLLVCPRCRGRISTLDIQNGGKTIPVHAVECGECRVIFVFPENDKGGAIA